MLYIPDRHKDRAIVKHSNHPILRRDKLCMYRNYLHRIANFCATVLNIFPKEIISNNTKCRKQKKHQILPMFAQFLLTLKFIFSSSRKKLFMVLYLRQLLTYLGFRKCERDCNVLRIILVQSFCPLKTQITRFPI